MHQSRRHLAVVATFGAVFFTGLLFTVFGGTAALPLVSERVLVLGQSGHIIRAQVGNVVDIQLGDPTSKGMTWRFFTSSGHVRVTPVYAASMPQACPPSTGTEGRETARWDDGTVYASAPGTMPGSTPSCSPVEQAPVIRLVRLTMLTPGVTTVKGWLVRPGTALERAPQSLPDFVFIVLVKA